MIMKFYLKNYSINRLSALCLAGGLFLSIAAVGQVKKTGDMKDLAANDSKITEVIAKMTLEEKVAMLYGNGMFSSPCIDRLGYPEMEYADGPTGIREELEKNSWNPLKLTTDSATFFPTGSALAATWNPELAYHYGVAIGQEAKTRGKDVLLAPAINIQRIPNGGRTFEYLSEDPFLSSRLTVGYVKGVQEQDVAACVKHFALNNQETNRGAVNIVADARTMREIYLPPFEAAVKEANAYTFMSAYNKINGYWCAENDWLLNQVLKKEWGFKGYVVSDWGGTHSTVRSAMNGLEVEMGSGQRPFMSHLVDSVKAGLVPVSVIDEKVKRILRVRMAIEPTKQTSGEVSTPAHSKIVYDVASQAIVLLKNSAGLLPIDLNSVKSIAVIGDNATKKMAIGGFGAGVKAKYEITPIEGLMAKVGNKSSITFAQGYKPASARGQGMRNRNVPNNQPDTTLVKEAVELAKNSDIAIIFAGTNREVETEGTDRMDIKLPFGQNELIKAVVAANPKTIVVVVAASPVELNEVEQHASAILFSWFNGSEGGNALADILVGNVSPSGKLPFTFPNALNDSPAFALGTFPGKNGVAKYDEGLLVGYRWFDTKNVRPLYPFGFGLSYTTFDYRSIGTDKEKYSAKDVIKVSVEIKNSGKTAGDEVVQLYVHRVDAKVEWPEKELKAFNRVTLKAGETKKVALEVPVASLRYWDETKNGWQLEPGKIRLMAGTSSADMQLTKEVSVK